MKKKKKKEDDEKRKKMNKIEISRSGFLELDKG